MCIRDSFSTVLIFFSFSFLSCSQEENVPKIETSSKSNYTYETVIDDIDIPWGMDFINEDELLVTEKSGTLYRVKNGEKLTVQGLPDIYVRGQGGLLDVALHPDYQKNKIIYLTLGATLEGAAGGNTALYCAKLNGLQLENPKLLYKAMPNTKKGQHWGSRIVFDQEGHVYFTVGDRGNRDVNPQDLTRDGGKVYRLNLDGSIPEDNPFVIELKVLIPVTEGEMSADFEHKLVLDMEEQSIKILDFLHEFNKKFNNILAVESGKGQSWYRYIGKEGSMITMESFGLSGTGNDVMRYFGFTVANIKKQMQKLIKRK
mgnify:CR=1 FL=1